MYKRFLFLLIIPILFSFVHDYYVSITTVDYNQKQNSLQITIQFTTHDLEKAIFENYNVDLNLAEQNESQESDSLLNLYIQKNFKIHLQGVKQKIEYLGREVDLDERAFLYFEALGVKNPKEIDIENSFLIEVFEAQQNVTHINVWEKQQSYVFTKMNTLKLFQEDAK